MTAACTHKWPLPQSAASMNIVPRMWCTFIGMQHAYVLVECMLSTTRTTWQGNPRTQAMNCASRMCCTSIHMQNAYVQVECMLANDHNSAVLPKRTLQKSQQQPNQPTLHLKKENIRPLAIIFVMPSWLYLYSLCRSYKAHIPDLSPHHM